jgi:hypothetical protein
VRPAYDALVRRGRALLQLVAPLGSALLRAAEAADRAAARLEALLRRLLGPVAAARVLRPRARG